MPETSVDVPALPRAAHTFQVQAVAEQDSTSQTSAWQSLPAVTPPCQKSPRGQGMSPREQALPNHSPLCKALPPNTECQENKRLGREVVWTKLDWSNLPPQAWAKSCYGRQKDTFILSKAQPENWAILSSKCIRLLLIKVYVGWRNLH